MDATLREPDTHRDADLHALICELREVISQLRRDVSKLQCEAVYWKSRHADAVQRNRELQWVFAGEDSVVYVLDPTRSPEVPEGHFPADAQGVLIVDRYSAYKAMKQVQAGKLILAF